MPVTIFSLKIERFFFFYGLINRMFFLFKRSYCSLRQSYQLLENTLLNDLLCDTIVDLASDFYFNVLVEHQSEAKLLNPILLVNQNRFKNLGDR